MTTLQAELGKFKEAFIKTDDCFVHFYFSQKGYEPIDPPVRANEFVCPFCGGEEFFTYAVTKDQKAWGCGRICEGSKQRSHGSAGIVPQNPKRAQEWPLFCELNGIGDLKHDVRFEKIEQSSAKVDYLLKFSIKPVGIILMQGTKGNGKTYASLGVCEYFTRRNTFAIFTTQIQMQHNWLMTFKSDIHNNYIHSIENCNLLVVDDFGTGDIPPGFMTFFFEVIDKRSQWSDRGTIITTNLNDADFSRYCGEALNDRIGTGQKMVFKDKSRRKQMVL